MSKQLIYPNDAHADIISKSNSNFTELYNKHGKKDTVEIFDDFLYQTITELDTPWILNKGTDGQATDPTIVAAECGKIVLTTGDNSGVTAEDASQIICAIPVQADSAGLVVETRLHINTAITGVSVNFGLTDVTTLEEPFTIDAGDLITSNASDAVCFVYDASADTKAWFCCAVDSDTDDTGNGKAGSLVVETCEDTWNEKTVTGVTLAVDAADFKVGSNSAKFTIADSVAANTVVASEVILSTDLTAYTHISFWFKSDVALDSGDFQILLDNTASCASPLESLNVPAISADTWTLCQVALATPANLSAIISIGLKQVVDKGACIIKIDDVRAYNNATYAPVADTYQTLRIEVSEDGTYIDFYVNGTHIKKMFATGVSPDVNLYATVIANSTTTASKVVDVDYIYVSHNR